MDATRLQVIVRIVVVGLLAFPPCASANAGTPLMWAGMLHLVVGNALIGLLEGGLLARLCQIPPGKAIGTMIAANYFSAWVGGLFVLGGIVPVLPMDLNNGWVWFWVMVVFSAGFWPVEGLRGKDPVSGKEIRFAYETPFGAWTVRNAVLLPSDKVLFQLGNDQICGFSPVDRRVALLWRGRGPVPVIEKDARE